MMDFIEENEENEGNVNSTFDHDVLPPLPPPPEMDHYPVGHIETHQDSENVLNSEHIEETDLVPIPHHHIDCDNFATPSATTLSTTINNHHDVHEGRVSGFKAQLAQDEIDEQDNTMNSRYQPHSPGFSGVVVNSDSHGLYQNSSLDRPYIRNLFVVPDCPIQWVTVYQDKAEVCRFVRPRVSAGEVTEILFKKLSPHIDKDSIRVEVRGPATIQDVNFNARRVTEGENEHARLHTDLRSKLRRELRHHESLMSKKNRLEKQRAVLETFTDSLIGPNANGTDPVAITTLPTTSGMTPSTIDRVNSSIDRYDPKHMDLMRGFFSLYEEQAEKIEELLMTVREEMEITETSIRDLEKSIRDIDLRHDEHVSRELTVLLEATESGQIELYLSYVVGNAKWTPFYDVRIYNNDGNLKIVYYGLVQQATGEDWECPQLSLSTSQPGVGGTVPDLGVQRMHFRSAKTDSNVPIIRRPKVKKAQRVVKALSFHARENESKPSSPINRLRTHLEERPLSGIDYPNFSPYSAIGSVSPSRPGEFSALDSVSGAGVPTSAGFSSVSSSCEGTLRSPTHDGPLRSMLPTIHSVDFTEAQMALNKFEGNMSAQTTLKPSGDSTSPVVSTQYQVPRPPTTIPCDNEQHRVTVGIVDLRPTFEFITAPRKAPYAYLKANMQNTSKFAFLPGLTNVYVDNVFVGKSEMGAVAPHEEFSCKLGADHGIRVNYNPMYKYREMSSSSGKNMIYTFKQLIEVKNTHERPIKLLVLDQLPLSGEDKIKVTLLEPIIKHPEKYDKNKPVRINKSSVIEWDLEIQAGETKELVLKYSIEYPATEEVTFIE